MPDAGYRMPDAGRQLADNGSRITKFHDFPGSFFLRQVLQKIQILANLAGIFSLITNPYYFPRCFCGISPISSGSSRLSISFPVLSDIYLFEWKCIQDENPADIGNEVEIGLAPAALPPPGSDLRPGYDPVQERERI
jgi:hypothetical protein